MSQIVKDTNLIVRCGRNYRTKVLEPLGLNPCSARLLVEICETPGVSQDTLARRLCLNKSVVARALAAMENLGVVERPICQKDKRITRLHPTQRGLELCPQVQAVWAQCEEHLTQGFTQEEMQMLQGLLERMKTQAVKWMEAEK